MSFKFRNRSFLKLYDFTPKEIKYLLDVSKELKIAKQSNREKSLLSGVNLVLLCENDFFLDRAPFEVAAFDQGARVTLFDMSRKEYMGRRSGKDMARYLGRLYQGMVYLGQDHYLMEQISLHAGIPIWNGMTQMFRPIQALADMLTMLEHSDKSLKKMTLCFMGDAQSPNAQSLLISAVKMGIDLRIAAPPAFQPNQTMLDLCLSISKDAQTRITITDSITDAVKGADFIYTSSWGESNKPDPARKERLSLLQPYRVTMQTLDQAQNHKVRFMHSLEAFHYAENDWENRKESNEELDEPEVEGEVLESDASVVWDQFENRVHVIKSVMVTTLTS